MPRENQSKKKQKTAINSSENWKIASSHKKIQENPHQNWKKSMLSNAKLLNICLHHFAAKFAQETPSKKTLGSVGGGGRAKISTPFRANFGPISGQLWANCGSIVGQLWANGFFDSQHKPCQTPYVPCIHGVTQRDFFGTKRTIAALAGPALPAQLQAAMANVWTVYCERLKGETASMIVAGLEFSLRQEAAMSRWIKGCRPSELALVRSAARDEMLSWARLSTTGRHAHDLIRAEPLRRFLPREFPVWRPHLREWIQTCRWLFREARYFHVKLVWGAVERQVSPLDILIGLSRLPGFEATLEDLAHQHHLLSDEEDS